jgi:GTP-binding protein
MIRVVESNFVKSAVKPADYYPTPYLEIAVAGKSNVGKSSLINTMLNRKGIAKVSSTPGKTKLINFFEIRVKIDDENSDTTETGYFSLADLPGYGFAKVSNNEKRKWQVMVENYFSLRGQLRAVFLLVDIRHAGNEKDKLMIELLNYKEIPFFLIGTKADKIGKTEISKNIRRLSDDLGINPSLIFPFSSLKKTGLSQLLANIEKVVLKTG